MDLIIYYSGVVGRFCSGFFFIRYMYIDKKYVDGGISTKL